MFTVVFECRRLSFVFVLILLFIPLDPFIPFAPLIPFGPFSSPLVMAGLSGSATAQFQS
jgi:hypothetical protein